MRREVSEVCPVRKIIRVTTEDQRFYGRQTSEKIGTLRVWEFVPSVTWISGYFPKNNRFISWVGRVGNEQAEEAKEAGGEKGSKSHQAIKRLLQGGVIDFQNDKFEDRDGEPQTLAAAEIECVMSFVEWFESVKPQVVAFEFTVWSDRYGYAGTVDLFCYIDGIPWIIDFKVSASIYPSHEIQVSAYKFANAMFPKNTRLAILQLNYKKNKKQKYKFTRIKQQFTLFLSVKRTWEKECEGMKPFQKDFPLSVSLSPELVPKELTPVAGSSVK